MMVKAIFLDVDDTLLDFNKNAEFDALQCAKEFGFTLPKDFMVTFKRINDDCWNRIQQGTLTIPELHKVRWKSILIALGIETDYEAFEWAFIAKLKECAIQVDYALELVQYLADKYPLYIASNATQLQQEKRLKLAEMSDYFQDIYTSERAKAGKPKKEFFDYCLAQCGYSKDEVIMIGDSISADISGAKQYGIQTIWYNPTGLPESEYADYTVKDLREIKDIL